MGFRTLFVSVLLVAALTPAVAQSDDAVQNETRSDDAHSDHLSVDEVLDQLRAILKQESCTVTDVLNMSHGTFHPPTAADADKCNVMRTTNCTLSYAPMTCPSHCGYLAPNAAFSCLFQCVKADECSKANPDFAYANPVSKVCMPCKVSGCKVCENAHTCRVCHNSFHDDKKGGCHFSNINEPLLDMIMKLVGLSILVLILFGILWNKVMGGHPKSYQNMVALIRARRHRHLSKVQFWHLNDHRRVRRFFDIGADFRKTNVMGVGIPLYFRNIQFQIFLALFCLTTTWLLYRFSDVFSVLTNMADHPEDMLMGALRPAIEAPLILMSPLERCGKASPGQLLLKFHGFAWSNCRVIGGLYVALFFISLYFVYSQKEFAKNFNATHVTMSDYALNLSGLPTDWTDEAWMRRWLEGEFQKVFPDSFSRPHKVRRIFGQTIPDERTSRESTQIEVSSVSICYDYVNQWAEIDDVLWKFVETMDLAHSKHEKDQAMLLDERDTSFGPETPGDPGQTVDQLHEASRKKAEEWFGKDSPNKLKNTGEAFVVFKYIRDREKIGKYARENPDFLSHPDYPEAKFHFRHVFSEPPVVAWHHGGVTQSRLRINIVKNTITLGLLIMLVQLFFVIPYAYYVQMPYLSTGIIASGLKTSIAGNVLGFVNGMLYFNSFMFAAKVGFHRKDRLDMMVVLSNYVIGCVNTYFNMACMVYMVLVQNNMLELGFHSFFEIKYLRAIGSENRVARELYNLFVPGGFIMGPVMGMFMAGWVPWMVSTCLIKIIYIWKCLPECLLRILKKFLPWAPPGLYTYPFRAAEKAFDPWEIPICGTYADQIVVPTVCFSFLFFCSKWVQNMFLGMLGWSIFSYFFQRFMHLRYHKACYYTTHRLDACVNYLWGAPLSTVAAACCHWAIRSDAILKEESTALRIVAIVATWLSGILVWVLCYHFIVRPWDVEDTLETSESAEQTCDETRNDTVYSWLNCNPVFVIKCKYFLKDTEGTLKKEFDHPIACGEDPDEVRFFEVGKQYLFIKPSRLELVYKETCDPWEFETWFERGIAACAEFTSSCRSHFSKDQSTWNKMPLNGGFRDASYLPVDTTEITQPLRPEP